MKIVVVQLPEFLHEYLLEVQRRHAHNGLEPEELTISAQLWEATTKKVVVMDPQQQPQQPTAPMPLKTADENAAEGDTDGQSQ